MKKIILTINDFDFERFKFEAIQLRKSIPEVIKERIFHREFSKEVTLDFENKIETDITKLLKDV